MILDMYMHVKIVDFVWCHSEIVYFLCTNALLDGARK